MTFHLMFVHIIFSSVLVAEWPPFGKVLPPWLTICSRLFRLFVILAVSRFGFHGGIWVLIPAVPGHCTLVAFEPLQKLRARSGTR